MYQDLCGEGSYVGKGIYDVDAFESALAGRVPEGAMLSHDLFEGIFARAGLVTDIEVVEEYPARYDVVAARAHRWARGDWQLLPWIFGRRVAGAERRRGAIPLIGLWKMLDNLRRTLLPLASVAALLVGWTLPLRSAALWTAFVLVTLALPTLPPVLAGILPRHSGISRGSHWRALISDVRIALSQAGLLVIFLAHQASLMGDAIVRTLYRLFVSHRHMLEWITAAQAQVSKRLDVPGFYRRMAGAVAIGIATLVLAYFERASAPIAVPFAFLWIVSPAVARWVSRSPKVAGSLSVTDADARTLRLIARRSWRYFETFVTAADHMLPPDNFQEDPSPVIAHRTSPTNLGLYLLATVTARDFGWAGTLDTVERLAATLVEMQGLERFKGHFYNWYGTEDQRPLEPKYVSSVDSGNLAAHLITLANACDEMMVRPVPGPQLLAGIADALALTQAARSRLPVADASHASLRSELDDALIALGTALEKVPAAATELDAHLAVLAPLAAAAAASSQALAVQTQADEASAEVAAWAEATRRSIESHRRDLAARNGTRPRLAWPPSRQSCGRRADHGPRDALRFSFRSGTQAPLDRLSRRGGQSRSELLRPARVRSAPREFRRDRQWGYSGAPLVSPGTRGDAG